jgi:hypothetical protein
MASFSLKLLYKICPHFMQRVVHRKGKNLDGVQADHSGSRKAVLSPAYDQNGQKYEPHWFWVRTIREKWKRWTKPVLELQRFKPSQQLEITMVFLPVTFSFNHMMIITIENIKFYSCVLQDGLGVSTVAFVVPMEQMGMPI